MTRVIKMDWDAAPTEIVKTLAAQATRLETPCGDGAMVWHRWDGPAGRTPAVLLHGGWGAWTHWIKTIPTLARDRTLFVADLPGMGDSADAPEPHAAESLSNIIADGVEVLLPGGAPYHAVCFSFGGVMGAWMAARHGERCRSLTLTGAAGFGDLHFVVTGITVPDPSWDHDWIDAVHWENLRLLMFADTEGIDPLALHVHRQNISRGRVRTRRISLSDGLLQALPRVVSPIGGIWGSADSTGGGVSDILKRRDILRTYQPDCAFDIIDGIGHWVMYEAPDIYLDALRRHLAVHEEPLE